MTDLCIWCPVLDYLSIWGFFCAVLSLQFAECRWLRGHVKALTKKAREFRSAWRSGEMMLDRVSADLVIVEDLLASGRTAEAHGECCRILDVMDGIDEAAAADARWRAEHGRAA